MSQFKVIKSKDGKYETVSVPDPEDIKKKLAEQHKELRDMLDGNTQFHDDPFKKPPDPPVTDADEQTDIYGYWGHINMDADVE